MGVHKLLMAKDSWPQEVKRLSGQAADLQDAALEGKRVAVLGLAREGIAVARHCAEQGATVTVSDIKHREELQRALQELSGLPIHYELGGHPLTLLDCDVLFVSPGIALDAPILVAARQRHLPLSSEARLFTRLCPAKIAGITGSSGKTTTCTVLARMLEADGRTVHLGGNIGNPLLGTVSKIKSTDNVVMELSSFQLDFFAQVLDAEPAGAYVSPLFPAGGWSPPMAAILNVTPNHLDRHPTMESYIAAKRKILLYQRSTDAAILGWDDPVAKGLARDCRGRVAFFSLREPVPAGSYLRGKELVVIRAGKPEAICTRDELLLRGKHNIANILAACAMASELGVTTQAMAAVARSFGGVPHRLELVRELGGVRWYNDSIATSPERAMAALESFDEPIILLAGGRDKHLPWEAWASLVQRKAKLVITFGEASSLIEDALLRVANPRPPVERAGTMARAVELAHSAATSGQVVLLSPGGTSFDAFHDYEERGNVFRELVSQLRPARG